ncbi:Peptidyl-tRNA hydrolase, PTH2 [uncultured Caudovirales phage]|uniref:peptidyl-tRNA hydrolase n=1 Tax=uncultured Caudovirales phage TaxID=2100421 RepID=A0A6J5RTU8_9CAUD|nr:Peptidyl-tRNA hydrolase, PTH2 [uncultured Caudovirales phage]
MAQAVHAAFQFCLEHTDTTFSWMNNSNYICLLSANNEHELNMLLEKANLHNIKLSVFREPDIYNQITAIALAPGVKSKKLCNNLKLALRDM